MSQKSREELRRFEQKMRNEGADGFADGPRPWESWDESGHQASSRIWEGSARRLYPGKGAPHSFGYRLLSFLAFIALATLLVGIGGVYFSHTQTLKLAQNGVQPLPVTDRPRPAITSPRAETVTARAAPEMNDQDVMTATAAGSYAIQEPIAAAAETATAALDSAPVTDEPALEMTTTAPPAVAAVTTPPVANGNIESVAIETIVTQQSVTTTVYTRHPKQDQAEVVAAIETTPPPFAQEIVAAPEEASDTPPSMVTAAGTEIQNDPVTALSILPPPAAQADIPAVAESDGGTGPDAAPLSGEQYETVPGEQAGDITTVVAAAEMNSETAVTEPPAEAEPEITGEQIAEQTGEATPVAAALLGSKAAETEITGEQGSAMPDMPLVEPAEEATTVALAETGREAADTGPAANASAEDTATQQIASVQTVTPVAKTGGWVINLASYTWKSTASKKLALFQQQGVDAEIFAVTINDKPMYRVRVTGFESSRQAKAEIPAVEQKLNLEGAWISRR